MMSKMLKQLVDRYEANSGANPVYSVEGLPEGYMDAHMKGIVAFEVKLDKVEAKAKLSQNRTPSEYANVTRELNASADQNSRWIGAQMAQRGKL